MNQRLETSNVVENFGNLEAQESIEQIEAIQDSTNLELEETQVDIEDREISIEEVWGEIAGKTIKGQRQKGTEITIGNLLKLSINDIKRGKIQETGKRLRDYLNQIFEIEGINIKIMRRSEKELIEKAKEAIMELSNQGKLTDIEKSERTKAIWGEIAGKTLNGYKDTKVTIPNILKLSINDIRRGKILKTEKPLRDYLNQIFEIEGINIEINSRSIKELIEKAKEAIQQLANQGKLTDIETSETTEEVWGEIAGQIFTGRYNQKKVTTLNLLELSDDDLRIGKILKTEKPLREYLNQIFEIEGINIEINSRSTKELIEKAKEAIQQLANQGKLTDIETSETTKEVWGEIAGQTIEGRLKQKEATIKNILTLSIEDFLQGKIQETGKPLREYLNQIFEIEGINIKIKTNSSKELIKEAKEAIQQLANQGKLIDAEPSETTKKAWGKIMDHTVQGNRKKTKVTIQNLQKLSNTDTCQGRIQETEKPLREYLNQIFEIEGINIEIKWNSPTDLIKEAKKAIRDLAIRGRFGELIKKAYIKSEIKEKQEKIQTLILEKINSISSKATNENSIEFDSMEEYVIGEILEKYVINKDGERFRLETNKNFQVEVEKNKIGRNPRLDFIISTEFTNPDFESLIIEWHPLRLDLVEKRLQEKIKKEVNTKKREELEEKLKKVKNIDVHTITNLKLEYSRERQALAEQILTNDITIVETFQDKKEIEGLYDFLKTNTITNSYFPENQEEFTTEFNNIYIQISTIQEMKKQRIARIEIEKYLETNQVDSIEELTNEQITKLWNKRFKFLGNQNKISQRIKNSETHTKKEDQETQIQYQTRNLIAFYNCDEYKLKDAELEAHIDQKIELIRSEISALESILEPEQDLEEIKELVTVDMQEQELLEPIEVYQEFQLTCY